MLTWPPSTTPRPPAERWRYHTSSPVSPLGTSTRTSRPSISWPCSRKYCSHWWTTSNISTGPAWHMFTKDRQVGLYLLYHSHTAVICTSDSKPIPNGPSFFSGVSLLGGFVGGGGLRYQTHKLTLDQIQTPTDYSFGKPWLYVSWVVGEVSVWSMRLGYYCFDLGPYIWIKKEE